MSDESPLASHRQMESEARRIAEGAERAGVTLRLIGTLAFERQLKISLLKYLSGKFMKCEHYLAI
jgi:hypothetical protein